MNIIYLQAPTLVGLPHRNLVAGTSSCTKPRQPTIYHYSNTFNLPKREVVLMSANGNVFKAFVKLGGGVVDALV